MASHTMNITIDLLTLKMRSTKTDTIATALCRSSNGQKKMAKEREMNSFSREQAHSTPKSINYQRYAEIAGQQQD